VTGPNDPENKAPRQPETETDQWKLPTWRRVGDFVSNVFQLERNIASLKEDNKRLRKELKAIQRQTNEQEGQLKVLLTFVQTALN
jgi:chaperonin cofactor prefoldin